MSLIPQKYRRGVRSSLDEIVSDDYQCKAGWADVFLRSRVYHAEIVDIDHSGHYLAGHIRYQRRIGFRKRRISYPSDGLIRTDMHVRGIGRKVQLGLQRHPNIVFLLARPGNIDRTAEFGFFYRLRGPASRVDVIGNLALRSQIHRNHRELQARPALQEQHLVVVRYAHQLTDLRLCLIHHRLKFL